MIKEKENQSLAMAGSAICSGTVGKTILNLRRRKVTGELAIESSQLFTGGNQRSPDARFLPVSNFHLLFSPKEK